MDVVRERCHRRLRSGAFAGRHAGTAKRALSRPGAGACRISEVFGGVSADLQRTLPGSKIDNLQALPAVDDQQASAVGSHKRVYVPVESVLAARQIWLGA